MFMQKKNEHYERSATVSIKVKNCAGGKSKKIHLKKNIREKT